MAGKNKGNGNGNGNNNATNKNIHGTENNDLLEGNDANNKIYGDLGDDVLLGMEGNDHLFGEDGNDVLEGGSGNDKLEGGAGNDELSGGSGNDNIIAGSGDDQVTWSAGDGNDSIDGGDGEDTFDLNTSENVAQTIALSVDSEGNILVSVSGAEGGDLVLSSIEKINLNISDKGASLVLGPNLPAGIFGEQDEPLEVGGGDDSDAIDTSGSDQSVSVSAGGGDDTVSTGGGSDVIAGGAGDDTINAGGGDDTVQWKAGEGNDSVDGGDGFDELDINMDSGSSDPSDPPATLTIGADENGNVILQSSTGEILTVDGVEDIVISAAPAGSTITIGDLTGTDIAQDTLYFVGGAGVDSLDASATDRRINAQGNGGDDILLSGSGNDTLDGGDGNDYLDAGSGSGVDTVLGGSGDDQIHMTLGDEQGSDAIDIVDGGDDNDNLTVTFVEDTFHDLFLDVTSNGDGSFSITSSDIDVDENVHVSNVENLTLQATEAGLHFSLGSLSDTSLAANGVNFEGSEFNDFFDGSGTDVNLYLAGHAGDDALVGGAMNDVIDGGTGNDSQSGEGGDDWLLAGDGDDVLDGGAGWDTADYTAISAGVNVDLGNFQSQDTVAAGNDILLNIEAIEGSAFNDTLTGNDLDNYLSGNDGDDTIVGGAGFDTIRGGAGNDTITDADGRISGDEGDDTLSGAITYINDGNAVSVNMSGADIDVGGTTIVAGTALDGYGDTDTLDTSSGFVEGSSSGDHLEGSDDRQVFFGRGGNDELNGNGGDDTLRGGSGDDTIDGGDGNDFVNYIDDGLEGVGPTSGVTVNLDTGLATDNWGDSDTLSNVENVIGSFMADTIIGDDNDNLIYTVGGGDTVAGGGGNDLIVDFDGDSTMDGGDGDDVLIGARGNDVLTGGAGADTYRFTTTNAGDNDFDHDTITDFDTAEDILDLSPFTDIGAIEQLDLADDGNGNSVITIDGDRSITLNSVSVASLTAANFIFGGEPPQEGPGTSGDDVIEGTDQPDVLDGLEGNDRIAGLEGADTLDGGDDIDIADYSWDPAGVTVDLSSNTATDGWGDTDSLENFENIYGSLHADILTGDDGNNSIIGDYNQPHTDPNTPPPPPQGAADVINAGAGDDFITPGPGVDTVDGGDGFDALVLFSEIHGGIGGAGVSVTYGNAFDLIMENTNTAEIESHTNIEYVIGSVANDTFIGNDQDNFFNGIIGSDYFDGGAGIDTYAFSGSVQYVDLNTGQAPQQNSFFGTTTLVDVENVVGGFNPDGDLLIGNGVANILEGHVGNDTLVGGAGNDTLNGGIATLINRGGGDPGIDTVDYSYFDNSTGVTVTLGTGGADGSATDAFGNTDTLQSIENIIGSHYSDTLTGNEEDNTFRSMGGDDTLTGGDGADVFQLNDDGNNAPVFGHDTVTDFDPNIDRIELRDFSQYEEFSDIQSFITDDNGTAVFAMDGNNSLRLNGVSVNELDASNFIFAEPVFINDDENGNFLEGGAGNDTILGNGGNDSIYGYEGDDYLDAGSGSDNVWGGSGNDTIEGGSDWDNIYGEDGDDVLTDSSGGGWLLGGAGDDSLTGSANDWNELFGGEGNDILVDPSSGFLFGGPGNDILDGEVNYRDDPSGIVVNLTGSIGDTFTADVNGQQVASRTALDGYGDTDTLQAGVISLHGSNFDDSILGTDEFSQNFQLLGGDDWVLGGAGDDYFNAGSGNDYIDGGDNWDGISFWEDQNDTGGVQTQGVIVNLSSTNLEYEPGMTAVANQVIDPWGDIDQVFNVESVDGSYQDDVIVGTVEHNWLNGHEGNDKLFGGDEDFWDGDNLIGGPGNDYIDGQGGYDRAWYNEFLQQEIVDEFGNSYFENIWTAPGLTGISVDLESSTAVDQWGDTDTLVSIEHVEGSPYEDLIIGDDGHNALAGVAGDDVLYGRGDRDDLWGDSGDDELYGEDGDDWLVGGQGNDLIDGGSGQDHVNYDAWTGTTSGIDIDLTAIIDAGGFTNVVVTPDGQGGTDYLRNVERVTGTDHDDNITGTEADNNFSGFGGNDLLIGGDGNDWLEGGDDFDILDGGAGYDTLDGGENDDTLTGGTEGDQFRFSNFTNQGNPTSFGVDVITDFNPLEDTLDFNNVPFFNSPEAVAGAASEVGGNLVLSFQEDYGFGLETNSITLEGLTLAELPNLNIWYSPIVGTDGNDTMSGGPSSENFQALGGDDTVNAGDGNDSIEGGAGNDTLNGGAGDDWFNGGSGNDSIDGGDGRDHVNYGNDSREFQDLWQQPFTGVSIDMGQTQQVLNDGFGGKDTLTSIEHIRGTDYADSFIGGPGDDEFAAGAGDDSMIGGDGNDWFQPEQGYDYIDGGAGDDYVYLDSWQQTYGVTVNLGLGTNQVVDDGFGTSDTLVNIETIAGSRHNDTMTGSAGNDNFQGNDGNDSLSGNDADDHFMGGRGNDIIDGGNGWDHVNYNDWEQQQGVNVDLDAGTATDEFGDSDTLVSIESIFGSQYDDMLTGDNLDNHLNGNWGNDTLSGAGGGDGLYGDDGNDVIDGGAGNDNINGANGNDTITGGLGEDYLEGGAGDDLFIFSDGDTNAWDHVEDFTAGAGTEDVISLAGIASLGDFAAVQAAATLDINGGTQIDLGNGNILFLNGVNPVELHGDDFTFV